MDAKMTYNSDIYYSKEVQEYIYKFYCNSESENILSMYMEEKKPYEIAGIFENNKDDIKEANSNIIRINGRVISNQIKYCNKKGYVYYIVHNHIFGNTPSKSDLESFEKIAKYAQKIGMQVVTFGIIDMRTWNIRNIIYYLHSGVKEERVCVMGEMKSMKQENC